MDTTEIIVILGGAGLIALVLWYFFDERESVAAEVNAGGVQEIFVCEFLLKELGIVN